MSEPPPVAILCGGRGTRLREQTEAIPKALVEIGGLPILWHVIRLHAAQGFKRFVLCTGYRGNLIEDFIASTAWPEQIEITCHDTGADTSTGARILLAADHLGTSTFNVAYADGLADLDLNGLLDAHRAGGALATMTIVQPRSQFGVVNVEASGRVLGFEEKPPTHRWVNGGFFCFEPAALEFLDRSSPLEGPPLQKLAASGRLHAYRHTGFWECMDTYKDAVALNDRWDRGRAPWAVWGPGDPANVSGAEAESPVKTNAARGADSR